MLVETMYVRSHFLSGLFGFFIYTLVLAAAVLALPPVALQPASTHFIFLIGGLAFWRYSWGLTHYIRHWIYRAFIFPRWLGEAARIDGHDLPPHVYFLVTSYRITVETSLAVYRAAIAEAGACGAPSTIVASIVEQADESLIRSLFHSMAPPPHVRLRIVRMAGSGKRDALAQGFRAISCAAPDPDALVAVIDGDSIIPSGMVRACAPFFRLWPRMGALTTDEIAEVRGPAWLRAWHDVRFAQRHVLMCSLGLSRKVLTLTGRMSIFRASIITHPDFIAQVEDDSIDHWRLGRFKFLTGDDESSWYWLLKEGWEMLYVPDVVVRTIEHPPSPYFFRASTQLMTRWFGNMLRTNGRAIAVGPRRAGFFAWWCLIDQRLSMWTCLAGPVIAVFLAFRHDFAFIPIYIVWIGVTRWAMTVMLWAVRGEISWRMPFLIYYNQVWGSFVKTYMLFRLDRQSWTRQKTTLQRSLSSRAVRVMNFSSALTHASAVMVFLYVVGFLSGSF